LLVNRKGASSKVFFNIRRNLGVLGVLAVNIPEPQGAKYAKFLLYRRNRGVLAPGGKDSDPQRRKVRKVFMDL
jgi:hypothetical protein